MAEKKLPLTWEPSNENEVKILFGMLQPYLPYEVVMDEYSDGFPDCTAWVDGRLSKIEFELKTSNFVKSRKHDFSKVDFILCWRNDMEHVPERVKVIALKEIADNLELEGKRFILNRREKHPKKQWDKPTFFEELKARVDAGRYDLVKDLYDRCIRDKYLVYYGTGRHATFGVLMQGGKRKAFLQVGSEGATTIDFEAVPEKIGLVVRERFRERVRDPKDLPWVTFELDDQVKVGFVMELLGIASNSSANGTE